MLETLLISWIAISGVVTAATTYAKSLLIQAPFFQKPENAGWLSLLLQTIAFAVGALTAYASGLNVLASFPPFAAAPPIAGYVLVGFACLLGGQGGYLLLSVLSGHVVQPPTPTPQLASSTPPSRKATEYVPFVVAPPTK